MSEMNREIIVCKERENKVVDDLDEEVKKYKEESIRLARELSRLPDLELKLKESLLSSE